MRTRLNLHWKGVPDYIPARNRYVGMIFNHTQFLPVARYTILSLPLSSIGSQLQKRELHQLLDQHTLWIGERHWFIGHKSAIKITVHGVEELPTDTRKPTLTLQNSLQQQFQTGHLKLLHLSVLQDSCF